MPIGSIGTIPYLWNSNIKVMCLYCLLHWIHWQKIYHAYLRWYAILTSNSPTQTSLPHFKII